MEIKFIGNGSGFSKTNNNAFFIVDNDLYLIDCSMLNMNKIKELFEFKECDSINIFVTHMHGDHVSGIPNFIQFLYHKHNIKLNIIAPRSMVDDLIELNEICGVIKDYYNILSTDEFKSDLLVDTIKTEHTLHLRQGSYGYVFKLNNKICVYTGDSKNINSFDKYINNCDELYIDISYNNNDAHTSWGDFKNNLPKSKKIG